MSCSCGRLLWRVSPCGVGVYSRRGRSPVAGVGTPCGRFPLPALSVGAHTLPARVLPARALLWLSRSPARTLRRGRSPVGALCSRRALCSHPPRTLPALSVALTLPRAHSLRRGRVLPARTLTVAVSPGVVAYCSPWALTHSPRGHLRSPGALRSLWRGISRGAVLPARSPALLPLWARTLPLRRSLWRSRSPGAHYLPRACSCRRLCARGYVARTNPVRGIIFMQIRGLTCAFIIVKKQFAFWVVLLTRCLL